MNMYSAQFALFLIVTLLLYYTVLRKWQWQILLVASGVFYFVSGPKNLIFILVTALSTWGGGLALSYFSEQFKLQKKEIKDRAEKKALKARFTVKKRMVLTSVLVLNFGILAMLKYVHPIAQSLIIPLGISFYTFISMGYLIDQYYEKYDAERNFFRFLLFVSYFPQLIQGPINRFDKIGEQFRGRHTLSMDQLRRALLILGFGAIKKYAIADGLSDVISRALDHSVADTPGSMILVAILFYSVQQYCDFSGGIDMVLGISGLFGIQMMPNFRQPYFSTSLGDFWRRWHISLGAWMRDYVFYPFALTNPMQKLGKWAKNHMGKHFGKVLPASIANLLVFFLVGIWHGSEWHYIFWGLYNGLVIALSDICEPAFQALGRKLRIPMESKGFHVFRVLRTFVIVNIGWYFDRIYDIRECWLAMRNTLFSFQASEFVQSFTKCMKKTKEESLILAALLLVVVLIRSIRAEQGKDIEGEIAALPVVVRWILYYAMIVVILSAFGFTTTAGGFMYANF